jgi:ActR/RegA family two-component response regulator
MTEARSLLIVDDDAAFRERLVRAMRDRGYEATGVADHSSAIETARDESPELALVDLRLPGESGLAVVRDLKALDSSTVVVVLTGYGSIATAVESIKLGAASYLTKPADADQIVGPSMAFSQLTMCRHPRLPEWSGSTSSGFSRTVAGMSRKQLAFWAFIGDRCNGSSRSVLLPVRLGPWFRWMGNVHDHGHR